MVTEEQQVSLLVDVNGLFLFHLTALVIVSVVSRPSRELSARGKTVINAQYAA